MLAKVDVEGSNPTDTLFFLVTPSAASSPPRAHRMLLSARVHASLLVGYGNVFGELVALIESARRAAARSANAVMTATYFLVGRAIVEEEQKGAERAAYGDQLLERLGTDLSGRFGRGFSRQNLQSMRIFYATYDDEIRQTLSGKSGGARNRQTASGNSELARLAARFSLPWSHHVLLLGARSPEARAFYETEALRGG